MKAYEGKKIMKKERKRKNTGSNADLLGSSVQGLLEMNQQQPNTMSLPIYLKIMSLLPCNKGTAPVIVTKRIFGDIATVMCYPRGTKIDRKSKVKSLKMPGSLQFKLGGQKLESHI